MVSLSLRQVVLYALVAFWTVVVVVGVEEQKSDSDAVTHVNGVQQTQDLTSLSKLITRPVYNRRALQTRPSFPNPGFRVWKAPNPGFGFTYWFANNRRAMLRVCKP